MFFGLLAFSNRVLARVDAVASRNWSGYMSQETGVYSGLGAGWIVPKVSSTVYSADATWVGLGGIGRPDLIQVGTRVLIGDQGSSTSDGDQGYKAWYQILPGTPVTIPVAIKPGDLVAASIVRQSTDRWSISFNNLTTGQKYQTFVHYISSMASAEWVQEMPQSAEAGTFVPLDDFGTVAFVDSWTILNGNKMTVRQIGGRPIDMIDLLNRPLATASALSLDGTSFSVVRVKKYL